MSPEAWTTVIVGACTLIGIWVGWARYLGPRVRKKLRRLGGMIDSLAGRDPIVDPVSHRQIAPPLPPLGERLAGFEDEQRSQSRALEKLSTTQANQSAALDKLATTVQSLVDAHKRLDDHDRRLESHGHRLDKLELARVERIVTQAESAQAWRAVADKDAELVEPEDDEGQ